MTAVLAPRGFDAMTMRALVAHLSGQQHERMRDALVDLQLETAHVAHLPGVHTRVMRHVEPLVMQLVDLVLFHLDEEERELFPVMLGHRAETTRFAGALAQARAQGREVLQLVSRLREATLSLRTAETGAAPQALAERLEGLARELHAQTVLELDGVLGDHASTRSPPV